MSSAADTWTDQTVSKDLNDTTITLDVDEEDRDNRRPISVSASVSTGGSKSKTTTPAAVRDDWEMDDDEEDNSPPTDERNKQIWEDANTQEHHPMPSLVIDRGSSSIPNTVSLPLNEAPTMRILKRPSPSQSPSQSSTNLSSNETFQQREARYQAARERIFGTSDEASRETGQKKNSSQKSLASQTPPPNSAATVVREPRGPSKPSKDGQVETQSKGFGERKAKRPPPPPTTKTLSSTTTSISP